MGLFDNNNKELDSKIKNLDKFQQKLSSSLSQVNSTISQLKKDLEDSTKRSPDYEKEARQASKKTSEFRNRANETLEKVEIILDNCNTFQKDINIVKSEIDSVYIKVKTSLENFNTENDEIEKLSSSIKSRIDGVQKNIDLFEETIQNHPDLENEIIDLETSISLIKENESKSTQLVKSITNRKIELETLYNEILGYEEKDDETDDIIQIVGIKYELEHSLDGLEKKTSSFKKSFDILEKETIENVNNLLKINSEKVNSQIQDWEVKYKKLNTEIEELLPKALTAGLSHAFSEKKEVEDKSYDKHKRQFRIGIIGMIAVSLIPFIISLVTIFGHDTLDIIINRTPKLVIAILPLYIPVLWLSISSSKKMNLSKRLIEEYTHKEVLSKTYEGLSKQVQNIEEESISKELRIKLLQDFLQMYSENPGKLISDYNNSDHPIMELLENSNKLNRTISKLENIPGLNKVANLLEKKSDKKLEQATDAIEKGLDKAIGLNKSKETNE
ncbi:MULTISPECIES: hypothetical protein [Flavobacterium]|uniref:Chromosome partition protein Smc n=1 Tax=Flavobacterium jumunjinense TaxID=998845 RepID=A0ABV5GQ37_9FLAO|nr:MULTISPECIES: hypothetical protein [Flavobacterium]